MEVNEFNRTEKKILETFRRHGISMSRCLQTPRLVNTARQWDTIDRERMSMALYSLINKGILKQNNAGYIITLEGSKYIHDEKRTQYPRSV